MRTSERTEWTDGSMPSKDAARPVKSSSRGIEALLETSNYRPFEEESTRISGLTDGSGSAGTPGADGDFIVHMFSFAAWLGATDIQDKLILFRPIESEPIGNYHADAPAYSMLDLRVRLSVCRRAALVEEILSPDGEHPELVRLRTQLQAPVEVHTELGLLTLDRTLNWFRGSTTWGTSVVDLSLDADDDGESVSDASLKTALNVCGNQSHWNEAAVATAVKQLLPLKNETWLDDRDPLDDDDEEPSPLTEAEFGSRLTPKSIAFGEAGRFSIVYDDGDLFFGHDVEVSCSLEQGPYEADI